jgi:hypothetical protein
MRARAAYISSLGTGGIIVASALLMLALVSALVAFHAWPGENAPTGTLSVPLSPSADATTFRATTPAHVLPARAGRADGSRHASSRRGRAASVSTAGLRKVPAAAAGPDRLAGVFKVEPTPGPPAPPVFSSPPSTGPQTAQPTTQYVAPKPQDDGDHGLTRLIPTLPLPGGATGPVEQVPLPAVPLGGVADATGITLPSR